MTWATPAEAFGLERFSSKVAVQPDGCWLWTGSVISSRTGYGGFQWSSTALMSSHRAAWLLSRPYCPAPNCVLHRCDVRLCVNPAHLFAGDRKANMVDMVAKGRHRGGPNAPRLSRSAVFSRLGVAC